MIHAKHPNITVALKSIEKTNGTDNCSAIDQEGNITYFYADPDGFRAQWFGSYRITIDLSLAGATVQKTVPVIVYWNAQKVKAMLAADVLSAGRPWRHHQRKHRPFTSQGCKRKALGADHMDFLRPIRHLRIQREPGHGRHAVRPVRRQGEVRRNAEGRDANR